jgi:hypothetical protein
MYWTNKHVLACTASHCAAKGANDVLMLLRREVLRRGLDKAILVNNCGTIDLCDIGPNIVVYPDGVIYSGVTKADRRAGRRDGSRASGAEPRDRGRTGATRLLRSGGRPRADLAGGGVHPPGRDPWFRRRLDWGAGAAWLHRTQTRRRWRSGDDHDHHEDENALRGVALIVGATQASPAASNSARFAECMPTADQPRTI